ncbi:MAG: hypothetical protein ACPL5F_06660 [Moorellaceae bacterium]
MDVFCVTGNMREVNPDLSTSKYISIQVCMGFVNKSEEKANFTRWFTSGDTIDALVKDGQALALHRESRPGEQAKQEQIGVQRGQEQKDQVSSWPY